MMKINEFRAFYNLSRSELCDCIELPKNRGETAEQYRSRVYQRMRRRETSKWDMMYCDGVVTMRAPDGAEHRHNARRLDDLIKAL